MRAAVVAAAVVAAAVGAVAAPVPADDWWVEVAVYQGADDPADGTPAVPARRAVNVRTGQRRHLDGPAPALNAGRDRSPDGTKRLAVRQVDTPAGDTRYQAVVTDADGGDPRPLLADAAASGSPHWSADGKRVYLAADRGDGDWHVYAVTPDGTDPVRLTRTAGKAYTRFLPLPDGRVLYTPWVKEVEFGNVGDPADTARRWCGPMLVTDGKAEVEVWPTAWIGTFAYPDDDPTRAAFEVRDEAGGTLVLKELRPDGRTAKLTPGDFRDGWKGYFDAFDWRPDGAELAVTFAGQGDDDGPAARSAVARHLGVVRWAGDRPKVAAFEAAAGDGEARAQFRAWRRR